MRGFGIPTDGCLLSNKITAMAVCDGISWITISMSGIMPGSAFQEKRGRPSKMAPIMDPVRTCYQRAGVMP